MREQEINLLYDLQEQVLSRLYNMGDEQLKKAKLCGGTALARCFLNHRVSYDLDFFIPNGFRALDLSITLKNAGFDYEIKDMVVDKEKANQLHTYIKHKGKMLKVSFIEDSYFEVFPGIVKDFGGLKVFTEGLDGLYHRKLRTVSGNVAYGEDVVGGRQKARDLFDLYVLSIEYLPISDFIKVLPYQFPESAFNNGLANMPWYDLINEFSEIVCTEKYNIAKSVDYIQNHLFNEIGASVIVEDIGVNDSHKVKGFKK